MLCISGVVHHTTLHYMLSVVLLQGPSVYAYVLHTLMHYTTQHTTEHTNTGDDTEVLSRP